MYNTYVIRENDTLQNIADFSGATVDDLIRLNGINQFSQLAPGMALVVPKQNTLFQNYIIQKGDTIYGLAEKYKVNADLLLQINGLEKDAYIYPGQPIIIPRSGVTALITEDGDTMDSVAKKVGGQQAELIDQNQSIYLLPEQLILYKKD